MNVIAYLVTTNRAFLIVNIACGVAWVSASGSTWRSIITLPSTTRFYTALIKSISRKQQRIALSLQQKRGVL